MEILTINQRTAAELLGVTPRRLRQIQTENPDDPPPRDQDGQYPARQFGDWLRQQWQKSVGIAADGTVYDYDQERARLTHHQANAAAQDDLARQARLIPAEQVQAAWSEMVTAARSRLLALPSRVAGVCAGKGQHEIEQEARALVYEALAELAAGNSSPAETESAAA